MSNSDKADAAKTKGNASFKEKNYQQAIEHFSEAIKLVPDKVEYLSNRSMAYLRNGNHEEALKDAEQCVSVNPDWSKGYSRKGAALLVMKNVDTALACYMKGLEVEPDNQNLLDGVAACKKAQAGGTKKKKKKKKKGKKAAAATAEEEKKEGEDGVVKKNNYVIGIDLGTTYSCVGVWKDNKVKILETPSGQRTIPSYVCLDPDTGARSIGHAAKNQATRLPQNVLYDVKRFIGQRYTDAGVSTDVNRLQYKVKKGEEGKPTIELDVKGETKQLQPEEVSAMVLAHCKELAESELGCAITRAVVTVPAYFNDSQRNATKAAGRIAGLDVLRIINEPTAAALGYGLDNMVKKGKPLNVLIFDLGGGTFDVSILTIEGGLFEVKATGGDTRLGGEDFDKNLMDHLINEVERQGLPDAREDPKSMQRLRKAAENCKRELSDSHTSEVRLDAFRGKGNFSCKVSRKKFETLNQSSFTICMETVKRVLKDAKLDKGAIDEIVLVGGSTRIPKLQELLMEHFGGKALCKSVNPDEAVAYGAAIQGAILSGIRSSKTESLLLMDVTPLSLGIEIEGGTMSVVIPRNTPIPCVKTQTYTTERDNQTEDTVPVYEGERLKAAENNLLGKFTITGIQKAKKGVPQLDVTFSLDSNGILEVTCIDQKTKAKANVTIADRSRATTDEIDEMVAEAKKFKTQDQDRLRKIDAKNRLEEAIYDALEVVAEQEESNPGQKVTKVLKEAAEKDQKWLDDNYETAKTTDIAMRGRALRRRFEVRQ